MIKKFSQFAVFFYATWNIWYILFPNEVDHRNKSFLYSSNPTDVVFVIVSGLKIGKGAWYWDHRSWSMRYIRYSNLYLALIFQIQFGWENKLIHSKKTNFLRNIRQFWPKCGRSENHKCAQWSSHDTKLSDYKTFSN